MKANNSQNYHYESNNDMLITKKKTAQLLSMSIRSLDRLVQSGAISKVYIGRSVRFKLSDITNIIQNGV